MHTEPSLAMQEALLPLVGHAGYRRLLAAMYDPELLRAACAPDGTKRRLESLLRTHDVEAIPRRESVLDSDSKSRIYVVRTFPDAPDAWTLVLKWYNGARQQQAPIEARMSTYFRQRLAPLRKVAPILAVVPLSTMAENALSVALLPYLGDETLYDRLHQLLRHEPKVEALVRQAGDTLAYTQVLGLVGHEEGAITLTHLSGEAAPAYFLEQIDSALLRTFAASGQPLDIGQTLLQRFRFFARVLGDDSRVAGLYYRGINPRNVMLVGADQTEIDFEQDSLRTRFIDIVSLLENGLEMTQWDKTADYPAYAGQMALDTWNRQRQRAQAALEQYNYLSHQQIENLTHAFIETTWRLEQQYLPAARASYSAKQYRLLLETARLFRHLQYVGYCKRNEQQTHAPGKRISSRYRQHFHALWAKVALDNLLVPRGPEEPSLPAAERPTATMLRHLLDRLPLGPPVAA